MNFQTTPLYPKIFRVLSKQRLREKASEAFRHAGWKVKTGKHFERVYGGRVRQVSLNHRNSLCYWLRGQIYRQPVRDSLYSGPQRPPSTELWRRSLVTTVFLPFPHVLRHPRPRYVIVLVYSVICGFYYLRLPSPLSSLLAARSRDAYYPTAFGLTSIQIRRKEDVDVRHAVSADKL